MSKSNLIDIRDARKAKTSPTATPEKMAEIGRLLIMVADGAIDPKELRVVVVVAAPGADGRLAFALEAAHPNEMTQEEADEETRSLLLAAVARL